MISSFDANVTIIVGEQREWDENYIMGGHSTPQEDSIATYSFLSGVDILLGCYDADRGVA